MIVGPRYNDVDPAVEAGFRSAVEAETADEHICDRCVYRVMHTPCMSCGRPREHPAPTLCLDRRAHTHETEVTP